MKPQILPPAADFDPVDRFEKRGLKRVLARDHQGDWDAYQTPEGETLQARLRPGTEAPAFLAQLAQLHGDVDSAAQAEKARQDQIDVFTAQVEAGTPLSAADLRRMLALLARRRR